MEPRTSLSDLWAIGLEIELLLVPTDVGIDERQRLLLALVRATSYTHAVHEQVRDVAAAIARTDARFRKASMHDQVSVTAAHFCFICWHAVAEILHKIRENGFRFRTPREVLRKHKKQLAHYSEARHHLEHFPERLPGENRSDWKGDPQRSMTGSVAMVTDGAEFVFLGDRWDVSPRCAESLTALVEELLLGIREEARSYHEESVKKLMSR